uniref:CWH43-like N-terminal domain-containing protein n=1 Tax=Buteo japonicus TaxID=224669 RepID=A0A8C0BXS2_9AVES
MVAGSSCGTGKCLGLIRALGPRAPGLRVSVAAGCISRALQWLWAAEPCPGPAVLGAANRPPGECPSGVLGSPGQPGACSCPVPPEAAPPSSSCSSCPPRQGGTALGCLWLAPRALPCPRSKCGTLPPESCFFSLICSLGSFMGKCPLPGEQGRHRPLRPGVPALLVSPLQVDHAKVLHYIGAGVAFPTSMLFLLLQSILTYRMAKTRGQYWTGHLRSILTAVAFLTLVFSGVFFIQESFVLQHVAALCEWMFIIDVLVFYGTFTFEFGAISTDTFLVLLKASRAPKSYKGESGVSSTAHIHSHAEGLAMA